MKWLVLLKEYTISPRRAREIAGKSLKIGFSCGAPMRAGAAWEKWGGPCGAKARPSSFASWRSMGGMGRAVRSQGPTFLFASWRSMGEMGRAVRSQARPSSLRAGAAWEKWGGPCGAKARPSSFASWRSMGGPGRAVRSPSRRAERGAAALRELKRRMELTFLRRTLEKSPAASQHCRPLR